MPEATSLDLMLQVDSENALLSMAALRHLCPGVEEGLEEFAGCFERLGMTWGKVCDYDTHNHGFSTWATNAGVPPEEALRLFSKAKLVGGAPPVDPAGQAHTNLHKALSAIARTYLTVRIRRDFLFGLTDLLRLRLTAAAGYYRVQCETAALVMLMSTESALAQEWFAVLTEGEGQQF